jgi:ketosteroid isomerase-like protein
MLTKRAISKPRVLIPIILCGIMVFWSIQALSEEWTEAQKEVWSAIENRWDKIKRGDLYAIEAGMHDDVIGWSNRLDTPVRKALIMGGYSLIIDANNRPVTYELIPYAIQIFGDIANVFYTYKWKAESKLSNHGRALVSLKKQNGQWLIVSSLNASCVKLPLCLD